MLHDSHQCLLCTGEIPERQVVGRCRDCEVWVCPACLPATCERCGQRLKAVVRVNSWSYRLARRDELLQSAFEQTVDEDRLLNKSAIAIQEKAHRRGIAELLHFTHGSNLGSILRYGLLPRTTLNRRRIAYVANDESRLDHAEDHCSLSIGFPNYRMFYKYRLQNDGADWVVLSIDPSVLWLRKCEFCPTNAASAQVRTSDHRVLQRSSAFEAMFAEREVDQESLGLGSGKVALRAHHRLPDHFPTDPQAEVLVRGVIRAGMIRKVYWERAQPAIDAAKELDPAIPFEVEPEFFGPRVDWRYWKRPPLTTDRSSESGSSVIDILDDFSVGRGDFDDLPF